MPCGHGVKATKHKIVKEKRGRFKILLRFLGAMNELAYTKETIYNLLKFKILPEVKASGR